MNEGFILKNTIVTNIDTHEALENCRKMDAVDNILNLFFAYSISLLPLPRKCTHFCNMVTVIKADLLVFISYSVSNTP